MTGEWQGTEAATIARLEQLLSDTIAARLEHLPPDLITTREIGFDQPAAADSEWVLVVCDWPGCEAAIEVATATHDEGLIRQTLAGSGWNDADLCPQHSTTGTRAGETDN